jgi:hypothetical protein
MNKNTTILNNKTLQQQIRKIGKRQEKKESTPDICDKTPRWENIHMKVLYYLFFRNIQTIL